MFLLYFAKLIHLLLEDILITNKVSSLTSSESWLAVCASLYKQALAYSKLSTPIYTHIFTVENTCDQK